GRETGVREVGVPPAEPSGPWKCTRSPVAMRTLLRRTLVALLGVVIVGGALLWALPEIVRRVALDQVPRRTGRAITIEDIDLNLFTRRLSVRKVRLDERGGPKAFVELERLDARLAPNAVFRRDVHVPGLPLVAPSARVVRTALGAFNFSALLPAAATEPAAGSEPGRWTVTVDRLTIKNGALHARDEAVAPPAEWNVREVDADAYQMT